MPADKRIGILLGNRSDTGRVREKNEDSFGQWKLGNRRLFVVADGMGGEAGGQMASRLAVEAVRECFDANADGEPQKLLREAVIRANQAVMAAREANPEFTSMGTTTALVLVEEDKGLAWIAHVGDSRIYLLGRSSAVQLTKDHTRIQQMLDASLLTAGEAADHPQRHVLSQVVGNDAGLEPEVADNPITLKEGQSLLICSDGLSDAVQPEEMAWAVSKHGPQKSCEILVDLANQRGGHDNITVQIVYAGLPRSSWQKATTLIPPADLAVRRAVASKSGKSAIVLFAAATVFLILLGIAGIYYYSFRKAKEAAIENIPAGQVGQNPAAMKKVFGSKLPAEFEAAMDMADAKAASEAVAKLQALAGDAALSGELSTIREIWESRVSNLEAYMKKYTKLGQSDADQLLEDYSVHKAGNELGRAADALAFLRIKANDGKDDARLAILSAEIALLRWERNEIDDVTAIKIAGRLNAIQKSSGISSADRDQARELLKQQQDIKARIRNSSASGKPVPTAQRQEAAADEESSSKPDKKR